MADTPVFQGHHLIEQIAFEQSQLLKSLARSGHFALHGPDNILNLPANPTLATRLSISPHSGGPLSAYSDQLKFVLDDLAETSRVVFCYSNRCSIAWCPDSSCLRSRSISSSRSATF